MDRRFGAWPHRQFRRHRPAGRKGRAAHPAVGTARLRLTPDRLGIARWYRAGRSHPHKARPRAALLLGRAGAATRTFGAVPLLILAHRRAALAAKAATTSIPIVFVVGFDPVQADLVMSLNRPGGNVTGISFANLGGKRLELARELVPNVGVIAVISNPNSPDAV